MRLRFRLAEGDHQRYGSDWITFDEAALTTLRASELRAIEAELHAELGMYIIDVTRSYRSESQSITALLALMWMARRLSGITEPLSEFNPMVLAAVAEMLPGDDADPPATTSSPSPSEE